MTTVTICRCGHAEEEHAAPTEKGAERGACQHCGCGKYDAGGSIKEPVLQGTPLKDEPTPPAHAAAPKSPMDAKKN